MVDKKAVFVPFLVMFGILLLFMIYNKDGTGIYSKDGTGISLMLQPGNYVQNVQKTQGRLQPTTVSGYIIPSEEKIKNMSITDQILTAHKYSDHIDVLCRQQIRIGSTFDGGKHICVDESIKPKFKECLVYSFGYFAFKAFDESQVLRDATIMTLYIDKGDRSNCSSHQGISDLIIVDTAAAWEVFKRLQRSRNEFSFESNTIKHFGCEVHTFDPLSMNEFSFETDAIKHFGCEVHTFDPFSGGSRKPQGCTFHSIGLGGKDETRNGKRFQTLSSVMKDLKHSERVIDILKIDVEQSEWEFFENVLNGNVLTDNVKQIAIEIHFPGKNKTLERQLNLLRRLHQSGFLTFSRERNTFCRGCSYSVPGLWNMFSAVTEFSYLNTRFFEMAR